MGGLPLVGPSPFDCPQVCWYLDEGMANCTFTTQNYGLDMDPTQFQLALSYLRPRRSVGG